MTAYNHIPDLLKLIPEIPSDSIVSRTVHNDEDMRVTLFGFAQGQELTEHTASQPAVLHFLQGEAKLQLGDDEAHASAGSWVHMPANLPHSIYAETPLSMLLLLLRRDSD
jgi:quercetin dioxygenase-like cupin family protein